MIKQNTKLTFSLRTAHKGQSTLEFIAIFLPLMSAIALLMAVGLRWHNLLSAQNTAYSMSIYEARSDFVRQDSEYKNEEWMKATVSHVGEIHSERVGVLSPLYHSGDNVGGAGRLHGVGVRSYISPTDSVTQIERDFCDNYWDCREDVGWARATSFVFRAPFASARE